MIPTDPNEIGKHIDSLKNKNSSGHNKITSTFLKNIKSAVVQPLSILINKSLETGIVPDKLKLAKVIPIYKSKDKELLNNYRPISLLPTISKIMEKLVHKRLYNFMHSQSVLYPGQYGFRNQIKIKSKDKELLNNYRPISLLPTISKIMEKLVHKRLYNFMHSQSVLYPGQYGFRAKNYTCCYWICKWHNWRLWK